MKDDWFKVSKSTSIRKRSQDVIRKATKVVERQTAALAAIEKEVQWIKEREKLLVDFIRCQEEVEQILQLQEQMLAGIDAAPDPEAAAAAAQAQTVADLVRCSSWCTLMAAKICVGHITAVKGMDMQAWCAVGCKSFVDLSALLELCNRDAHQQSDGGADPCRADMAAAAAAAAAAAPQEPCSAAGSGTGTSNGNLHHTAAAATAAGNTAAAAAAAAAHSYVQGPETAVKEYMEGGTSAVFAALFYHPQPYYAAATCNLSTAKPEIMPQQHLMKVVERLQLSEVQVMHLRIANTEFVRLARVTSKEGESLAEQAAKLSLNKVLQHLDDKQPLVGSDAAGTSTAGASNTVVNSNPQCSPLDNAAQRMTSTAAADATEGKRSKQPAPADAAGAAGSDGGSLSGGSSRSWQGAVDAIEPEAGETPGEALSRQLDRYLRHMHIHTVVTAMCIVNTLTPRQLATLTVASFPYMANVHALAEACKHYTPPCRPGDTSLSTSSEPGQQQQQQQQARRHVLWSEPLAQQVEQLMRARNTQLELQVEEWWRRHDNTHPVLA